LLLGMGVSATIAQMAMTRAYRLGNTLVTANLQYAGIIFSSFWGILLWDDVIGPLGWMGIAVIVVSGLAASYYNSRNATVGAAKTAAATANHPIATEA
jgi:S-adenosylmethionine uptake transporter